MAWLTGSRRSQAVARLRVARRAAGSSHEVERSFEWRGGGGGGGGIMAHGAGEYRNADPGFEPARAPQPASTPTSTCTAPPAAAAVAWSRLEMSLTYPSPSSAATARPPRAGVCCCGAEVQHAGVLLMVGFSVLCGGNEASRWRWRCGGGGATPRVCRAASGSRVIPCPPRRVLIKSPTTNRGRRSGRLSSGHAGVAQRSLLQGMSGIAEMSA